MEEREINHKPDNSVTEQAKVHWEKRHERGYQREVSRWFSDFMEKYRDQIGPAVLDDGCGAGRNLMPLAREGYQVTGLDIAKTALEATKRRLEEEDLKAELVEGDIHDLPFKDGQFDTVVSHQSFQFNDWAGAEQCLAEAARVLRPGGLFFLRVRSTGREVPPDAEKLDDRGITFRTVKDGDPLTYHQYSLEEIEELAEKNDLVIIEDPVDARKINEDGSLEKGQWNVVMRKKETD